MTKDQAEQMVNEKNDLEEQKETSGEPMEAQESVVEEMHQQEVNPEEALKQELAEMKDQWLRTVAELENHRKRADRDKAELRKYAVTEFARDMSSVCENLYRALDSMTPEMLASEESQALKTLHAGVDMTRNELIKSFERHGIKRINPARGDAFDHNFHQAVSQVEDGGVADGTIAQVIQSGYRIHERLLQPAMVAVAKAASEAPPTVDTTV